LNTFSKIQVGKSDIFIQPLGIGTWSWGSSLIWDFGKSYNKNDLKDAFEIAIENDVNFFDTAEFYGSGNSEELLGEFKKGSLSSPYYLASKFMPYPWRLSKSSLIDALQNSLSRLKVNQLDLYQIHWPFPPVPIEVWAEALAQAVDSGLTNAVGVSNYNTKQMIKAYKTLKKFGVHLASNQVEYNLLNRKIEFNGLLKTCNDLDITLIAYSPLAQGLLTGKYTPNNPPPGFRKLRFGKKKLQKIQPLIKKLEEIGENHGGKTPVQVSLNWLIRKGTLPIPGVKNKKQTLGVIETLNFSLTDSEVSALDSLSSNL